MTSHMKGKPAAALEKAENKGRFGDSMLAHVTPGDLVIPRGAISPELLSMLTGVLPDFPVDFYTVGSEVNSINPVTGLPEFYDTFGGGFGDLGGGGYAPGQDTGFSMDSTGSLGFDGQPVGDSMSVGGNTGHAGSGLAPDVSGGSDGGGGNSLSGWLGGFLDGTGWSSPDYGVNGLDLSGSGLTDYTPPGLPPVLQPTQPPPPNNPVVQGLAATPPPNVPRTPVPLGAYYSMLQSGDPAGAANLLAPYLSANTNIYGR